MTHLEHQAFLKELHTSAIQPKLVAFLEGSLGALREEYETCAIGNELVRGKIQYVKELISEFDRG